MWIKVVDEIIMDLEGVIKHLESIPIDWTDKLEKDRVPSDFRDVMKIYCKELIESVKKIRNTDMSSEKKYEIINNNLVEKIIFWKWFLTKMDFEKHQSIKEKVLEELVRTETQLIQLRGITKEEMGI